MPVVCSPFEIASISVDLEAFLYDRSWAAIDDDIKLTIGHRLRKPNMIVAVMFMIFVCLLGHAKSTAPHRSESCRHVVIFKEPSSGSSWFSDELNKLKGVSVRTELYTARDAKNGMVREKNARDKMTHEVTKRCKDGKQIHGFTQNPNHDVLTAIGFDFSFLKDLHHIHYAGWFRSNFVLRAFSSVSRDSKIVAGIIGCTNHNSHDEKHAKACMEKKYTADRIQLLNSITGCACDNARIVSLVENLTLTTPRKPLLMLYEEFASDQETGLNEFLNFLEIPLPGIEKMMANRRHSDYVKRSSSNVSTMLNNAGDVLQWIREWSRSEWGNVVVPLEAMFLDTMYTSFRSTDVYDACNHMKAARDRFSDGKQHNNRTA